MERKKVLLTAPYMQPVVDRFRTVFEQNDIELVVPPVKERVEEADLLKIIDDIDGVICGDDRFTELVLRSAPKLKVISKWGTGIDSIDRAACSKLGIAVKNTPNAFSEPVADTVMGYILNFARKQSVLDRQMKKGQWKKQNGLALNECTLGVIGVGNVGKAVVKRAIAFGMQILGNDIIQMTADYIKHSGIKMVSKDELLLQADFITLNCDLNPTSYHLISNIEFNLVKPTAVIINTARGPIIDEPALISALQSGKIAGAGLDVFEIEPLPSDSPLLRMENVMLAPHNANSSFKAWERVHQNTINNLLEILKGVQK